jgi:hypothetical protein
VIHELLIEVVELLEHQLALRCVLGFIPAVTRTSLGAVAVDIDPNFQFSIWLVDYHNEVTDRITADDFLLVLR